MSPCAGTVGIVSCFHHFPLFQIPSPLALFVLERVLFYNLGWPQTHGPPARVAITSGHMALVLALRQYIFILSIMEYSQQWKKIKGPEMVTHICNTSTWNAEVGEFL